MTPEQDILNRLLDKYENSKHLLEPGVSHRRVMLSIRKKELPLYQYEDASIRDAYHAAASALESRGLISLEWLDNHLLLSAVILNLDQVMACYPAAGRIHPRQRAANVAALISEHLQDVSVPWIRAWADDTCTRAREKLQVPAFYKEEPQLLMDLLTAFQAYASMPEAMTMRAFSSKCYHDTKYFERHVREPFLRIARRYDPELSFACEESELGVRDQLSVLGIYARPELYELAGNCTLITKDGAIPIGAAPRSGLAIPSTLVSDLLSMELPDITCITFIENKTNYDEYLLSERQMEELVVYHGGFLSPQKRKLFRLLARSAPDTAVVRFWADIDLGGFQMFQHLQDLIPQLQPMRMDASSVEKYHETGLARPDAYLERLRSALAEDAYPLFRDAITAILRYQVTIEQEAFLN